MIKSDTVAEKQQDNMASWQVDKMRSWHGLRWQVDKLKQWQGHKNTQLGALLPQVHYTIPNTHTKKNK